MTEPQPPAPALLDTDIEITNEAAKLFIEVYYKGYDSDTRLQDLPLFYGPTSSVTWNGKPFQGVDGIRELIKEMPKTRHEVLSFDCHPVPGSQPPALLLAVSGNVTHGEGPTGNPPATLQSDVEGHPRVFSQTFMLAPDPNAEKGAGEKYYILADAFRFVG